MSEPQEDWNSLRKTPNLTAPLHLLGITVESFGFQELDGPFLSWAAGGIRIVPLLSQLSSMPTAFFSRSSMVLDSTTCWGLQFHSPLHMLTSGCPPSRTETLAHIAGLSGSPELLYRPHDLLNLASVVPVKPLSCGWLCQVLPTTWNGAWPPGQELWHLLYANSGNPFLGNCFELGTPTASFSV